VRILTLAVAAAVIVFTTGRAIAQGGSKTLVAVFAHPDDEGSVAPMLARYAREGAQVYVIVATDGAQGGAQTNIPTGPELARVRAEEARCAAEALSIHPPILLGFPDGGLGNNVADPALLYRLTQRVAEELQRLHPDAIVTWGPDGGTGHPDHRLVSDIVTQLARAGAPGVPERLFYASIPAEGMRALNPGRGEPPLLIPQAKYFTVRVPFTPADFDAARRSLACHRTQFPEDAQKRLIEASEKALNGVLALSPAIGDIRGNDVFATPR
jgi:LmbE family N-acetylglucosaminyl deacetylase